MTDTESFDIGDILLIPSIAGSEAEQIAIDMLIQKNPGLEFEAEPATLMFYGPSIVGNIGPARLLWHTKVASVPESSVAELVLVDAHGGEIALHYSLVIDALYRKIYDAGSTDRGVLRREEGDPRYSQVPDVDNAYDYCGDTYKFYRDYHGRDGIDNAGMILRAYVRVCFPNKQCPFPNAGWNWQGYTLFGEGFVVDDIVGHELTHGVTQYESGLEYVNESGAISESFSDMWGEWIDQTNGRGNDSEDVKWLLGEDLTDFWNLPDGRRALRNMRNPSEWPYSQPDSKGSQYWHNYHEDPNHDSGGVHINSGVGNKLCYLLTDGGTFNGYTVVGMGIPKVAELFYEVQTNLLTAGADYEDLYSALTRAAIDLGWNDAEKQNLERACQAVEIAIDEGIVIFRDTFQSTDIDTTKWTLVRDATIDKVGINEPSLEHSLRLDGHPSGGDLVESREIDLSRYTGAVLTYHYQRTGGGNSPEAGDDLIIDYYDGSNWVELDRQLGDGPDMTNYNRVSIDLPPEALRADFRLRIRNIGTSSGTSRYDDWFVDDIAVKAWNDVAGDSTRSTASDDSYNGIDEMARSVDDRGCFRSDRPDYETWIVVGKPDCWCSCYQAYGDIDGQTEGKQKYRVGINDLDILTENWRRKAGDPTFNPCADIDHDGRIGPVDLEILIANWKNTDADLSGDCPRRE
jgi:hypothetical protein